jgi:hypothetical protein
MSLAASIPQPARFQAGQLLMTAGIKDLVVKEKLNLIPYVVRHLNGDWGDIPAEDARANQAALRDGDRLLSAYQVTSEARVWIITESDRSATTVLLPEEY